MANGEAQAHSFLRAAQLGGEVWVEDLRQDFRWNAAPLVGHANLYIFSRREGWADPGAQYDVLRSERNHSAAGHRLPRIENQVAYYLSELTDIHINPPQVRGQPNLTANVGSAQGEGNRLAQQGRKVRWLANRGSSARESNELLGENLGSQHRVLGFQQRD